MPTTVTRQKPFVPDAIFLALALISFIASIFFPERHDAGEAGFQVYKETRGLASWLNYPSVPDTGELTGLSVDFEAGVGHIGTVRKNFTQVKVLYKQVTEIA